MREKTKQLPLFPLESIVFPDGLLALRIFETRYIDMVCHCMREQSSFVITANQCLEGTQDVPIPHTIGTRVDIVDFEQLPDGLLGITIFGKEKVDIANVKEQADKLLVADISSSQLDSEEGMPEDCTLLVKVLKKMFPDIQSHYGVNAQQYMSEDYQNASWVGARLVEVLPMDVQMKVELLRMQDSGERVRLIYEVLERMQII